MDSDRTLRDLLRSDGRLSFERASQLLADLAHALEPLHSAGQGHGAITPQSVYLDATGRAYPGPPAADTRAASLLPPAYLSPERIDGRPADPHGDVYTLGLLGWEMLTGQTPWAGESLSDVVLHQRERDLPALSTVRPDIPDALRAAIEHALRKSPAERWESATAMLAALDGRAGPSDEVVARAEERTERRSSAAAAAVAAVAAARPTVPTTEAEAAGRPIVLGPISANREPAVPVRPMSSRKSRKRGTGKTMALVALMLAVLVAAGAGVTALTGRREKPRVTTPWLDSLTSTSAAGEVVTTDTTNGSGAALRRNAVPAPAPATEPMPAGSVQPPMQTEPTDADAAARQHTPVSDSLRPASERSDDAARPAAPAASSDSARKAAPKPDSSSARPDTIPSVH